jgi:di/tricarboxylate transporter
MTAPQAIVFAVLGGALVLFAWGRWRYDLVALLALLVVVLTGIVPVDQAFIGFAHPAVITVAAVLVISRALQNAGVVDLVIGALRPLQGRPGLQVGAQTGLTALLSAVMNNVGALALLIPVALRNAYRDGYSPGKSLMPLAFGSLLGGLVTLIGTPPNIIISTLRQDAMGEPFRMFDFAPVGGAVAAAGVLFVVLVGWRFIPKARREGAAGIKGFDIGGYLLEGEAHAESEVVGRTIEELEARHEDARVLGIAREGERQLVPGAGATVRVGDVLILQGDSDALKALITKSGLVIVDTHKLTEEDVRSDEIDIVEVIVKPGSSITGKTPKLMRLRTTYRVNLLGVARHGKRPSVRLRDVRFQPGDVMLMQGRNKDIERACAELGCIPLAERPLGIGRPRPLVISAVSFAAAIAAVIAGLVPIHLAFVLAVVTLVLSNAIRLDEVYTSIDWPVLVLLGAMLPVGGALESTGGTELVADAILSVSDGLSPVWVLTLLLVSTMMLSDVINNNATAVLMAPIGLTLAQRLDVNQDAFLMAVAIGASCAFLTPIGHQSNTLVLAPGGYQFGDYWRMGLPLEVLITIVAIPMLLHVWPL